MRQHVKRWQPFYTSLSVWAEIVSCFPFSSKKSFFLQMLKTLLYVFIRTVLICRLLRCYYIKKWLLVHSHIRFHDANKYRTNAPFTELRALWKRNWQQLRSIFVEACNVHIYLPIRVEGVAKHIWLLRLRQQKNWIGFCDKTFVTLANGLVCRVLYRELSTTIDNSAFLSAFTWTK